MEAQSPTSSNSGREKSRSRSRLSPKSWHDSPPEQNWPATTDRRPSIVLDAQRSGSRWWPFVLREWSDDEERDWWFASTAIPLLAATLGPMANVFSIAALVTSWRMCLVPGVNNSPDAARCTWQGEALGPDQGGQHFDDPRWCYNLNAASLVVGFVGNIFLLFNFTNRVRYIIALPVTIVMWYIATAILIGITVCMQIYVPPIGPQQVYSQGFWYAVIAACMYMICSMLLMANMLGYFLGHYPQDFTLTDSQRTLILQTMLFFLWLAGGGAMFSRVETVYADSDKDWSFVNALYFSDVTILTVGFGDLYPISNVGRGLVFPYSVGGIIMLGLMVSSITKFAGELGSEKIIRRHVENSRARTIGRTVTTSLELERRHQLLDPATRPTISGPTPSSDAFALRGTTIGFKDTADADPIPLHRSLTEPGPSPTGNMLRRVTTSLVVNPVRLRTRKPRLLLLREEKDRFDAMRRIQSETTRFKAWYALAMSVTAFGLLWCVGAVVFWRSEQRAQPGFTYFQALYFCYVSLLTIGYGDLAPQSNAGRPFFVFWSLIAVPTMTILVSDLGETVINKFKQGTVRVADFTVLPQKGVWAQLLRVGGEQTGISELLRRRAARRRIRGGFQTGSILDATLDVTPTLDELAAEEDEDFASLARRLPLAIRRATRDLKDNPRLKYSYEQWVEFSRLIRFTAVTDAERHVLEEDEQGLGLVEWDWIGENSPMMAKMGEPEFVLERLLESMTRYFRRTALRSTAGQNDDDDDDGKTQGRQRNGMGKDDGSNGESDTRLKDAVTFKEKSDIT